MLARVEIYQGQQKYRIKIGDVVRELPLVKVDEGIWIASDAEIILGDIEFISEAAEMIAEKVKPFNPELIVTPEAKAIGLAYETAKLLGHKRLIIGRKSIKAYMSNPLVEEVKSITTREKQLIVLTREDAEKIGSKRVCLLDDVVSTGGTITSLERLVRRIGGEIVCKAAIWVEGPWYGRGDLTYLSELPIFVDEWRLKEFATRLKII
ncbi:MAG: phosphoribosyltransferase family protein [Nitrososphaeria archaeon]|nr:phosphoribosyltransferase family protein [Nitrososphaeria archaeon]